MLKWSMLLLHAHSNTDKYKETTEKQTSIGPMTKDGDRINALCGQVDVAQEHYIDAAPGEDAQDEVLRKQALLTLR
jgi:hypothetical protein